MQTWRDPFSSRGLAGVERVRVAAHVHLHMDHVPGVVVVDGAGAVLGVARIGWRPARVADRRSRFQGVAQDDSIAGVVGREADGERGVFSFSWMARLWAHRGAGFPANDLVVWDDLPGNPRLKFVERRTARFATRGSPK